MVLIISVSQDQSTIDVIKWLNHFGVEYLLINDFDIVKSANIDINSGSVELNYNSQKISFDKITSVWYRRGNLKFSHHVCEEEDMVSTATNTFHEKEEAIVYEYLHTLLEEKYSINNYNYSKVNKLNVLRLAQSHGIKIPNTKILDRKSDLTKFTTNREIINKPINNPIRLYGDTYWLPTYTTEIKDGVFNLISDKFGLSLFQEKIPKKFEIRSFLFDGEFYSMAIFSQKDKQTEVDFRCYNHEFPNRTVPFILPDHLSEKLKKIAKELNLNSCSFDVIYTTNNEYVFLEVNPIGQFGMVSTPCNYHLEKKIALNLNQ